MPTRAARDRVEMWKGHIFHDSKLGTLAFTEFNPKGGKGACLSTSTQGIRTTVATPVSSTAVD